MMRRFGHAMAGLLLLLLGARPVAGQAAEHVVVRSGETPEALARRVGADGQGGQILAHNGLEQDAPLVAGTLLELPPELSGSESATTVLFARGQVTVAPPKGAESRPPTVGAPLAPDSVVCTGPNGHATVRLAVARTGRSHDDITLLPETCITVASATSRGGRRASLIRLQQGSVTVPEAEGDNGESTVTVQTRAGITTAPAGGFRVHVEAAASRTEALTTPLTVVAAGVERPLRAGQGSRTRDGEAPGEAVDLLVASGLLRPPSGVPLRRPDFAWQALEQALEYRLEMAADPGFREMLRVDHVGLPSFTPDRMMLPYRVHAVWWRVAPVDRLGFVGLPSRTRVVSMPAGVGQ